VLDRLGLPDRGWFAVAVACEAAAFLGYVLLFRGVARVEGGLGLPWKEAAQVVAVGFGAFIVRGGAELDSFAFRRSGADEDEARVRVLTLDALEHAPLAPAAWLAAIALLSRGDRKPGLDFTVPWALLVPVGAAAAVWGVRNRERFVGREGWRGHLGDAFEAIHILFRLASEPRRYAGAFLGSTIYWLGDVACLWACLKPFHAVPALPSLVIAHAVGYSLTRRTLPLAGAGIVELLMPLTLAAGGAPLVGAIPGVSVYRLCNLWLPLVPALLALPSVRRLGEGRDGTASSDEPALQGNG
jgi:uncharacterized membrane protein YbhN (UPF0104 family)